MQSRSQRQNLKGIRQGKRGACEAVICENYEPIYRFLAYLSGDTSLAEDLTQETFVSAWANIGGYKGRASLKTWLHRIAYHKFVDSRRTLGRRSALMAGLKENGSEESSGALNPLHQLIADEHWARLWQAMGNLELDDYLVVVLHYVQGLSFREMSEVLDKPVGTVKWQTSRALKKLRAFLSGRIKP